MEKGGKAQVEGSRMERANYIERFQRLGTGMNLAKKSEGPQVDVYVMTNIPMGSRDFI